MFYTYLWKIDYLSIKHSVTRQNNRTSDNEVIRISEREFLPPFYYSVLHDLHTAKNDLLQLACYNFIRLPKVKILLNHTGLLQFVMQTCSKSVDFVDNKFGQSICNKSVDNLQQLDLLTSCRKSRERIFISRCCNKLLQDVNKAVATSSL